MFKNEFQGGSYLDVFSVQGKDPISKLKITGPSSAVKKEFHNDIRTFIISLHGDSARNKITFPKNTKHSLHLVQRFLVFQIFLQSGQSFTLETVLVTQSNFKVRLILSTSTRDIVVNAHHVKMPFSLAETDIWLNLCLDLEELVNNYFEGHLFGSVDSITISANCKLKRIFTVKERPHSSLDFPKPLTFPPNVQCSIQVLDLRCFDEANINVRSGTGYTHKRTPHKLSINDTSNTHIAFGSRIENNQRTHTANQKTAQQKSLNINESQGVSLTSRAIDILPSKPITKRGQVTLEIDRNNNIESEPIDTSKIKFQPRPPDKNSKKSTRQPRVVKSADVRSRDSSRAGERPKPQVFSKSADSRNRRKPSVDSDDDASKFALPAIMKVKKGISRSAVDLEKAEREISEKRSMHFKSKSLNVLPKIGTTRNNRYGKIDPSYSREELHNDNVFATGDEEDELLALADENEVDDYLKNRTRSSRDDDSISSCNSANSDLYLYSSRPRSVIKQRSDSSQGNRRSRNSSRNEPTQLTNGVLNVDLKESNRNRSRTGSRAESITQTSDSLNSISPQRLTASSESVKTNDALISMTRSRNNSSPNEKGMPEPVRQEVCNDTFTLVPKQNEYLKSTDDAGVDLSWEYSESTSMLVIPKELKIKREEDDEEETESGIVLENGDTSEDETHANAKMSEEESHRESTGEYAQQVNFDEEKKIENEEKENKGKSIISSSFIMRESCDSDSMSWLQASQDASVAMINTLDKMKSPQMALRQRLKEQLGSLIVQSKDGESESDCTSECSDDTTYTDLPPKRFRNYRYQDEIQSISSTLDLSATIPATPHVGEQARYDENNNVIGGVDGFDNTANEELLDLMFDPVLNCYYDPVTHKYYELN